ncbi:hypothetical protein Ancab_002357, partial [Ancistrocladus abbreviatus]
SLLRTLDSVWVGSYKIRVDVARDMKSSDIEGSRSNIQAQKDAGGKLKVDTTSQSQGLGVAKSYKEVLLRSGPHGEQFQQLPMMVFKTRHEESIWLKDCYVGQVRAPEHVHRLQDRLRMNGFHGCSVRRMGGKMVLLSSTDPKELHGMDEQRRQRIGQWLEDVQPWSPQEVNPDRYVWVRV